MKKTAAGFHLMEFDLKSGQMIQFHLPGWISQQDVRTTHAALMHATEVSVGRVKFSTGPAKLNS